MAADEVGITGTSLASLADMEQIMEGVPCDRVSMSLLCTPPSQIVFLSQYLSVAEKQGCNLADLRGSACADVIVGHYCAGEECTPFDLSLKLWIDTIEYCRDKAPLFHTCNVHSPYNLRESMITAPEEIAIGLAVFISGRGLLLFGLVSLINNNIAKMTIVNTISPIIMFPNIK